MITGCPHDDVEAYGPEPQQGVCRQCAVFVDMETWRRLRAERYENPAGKMALRIRAATEPMHFAADGTPRHPASECAARGCPTSSPPPSTPATPPESGACGTCRGSGRYPYRPGAPATAVMVSCAYCYGTGRTPGGSEP